VPLAKEIRKKAERLITRAKKNTPVNRRHAAKYLPDEGVKKLFNVIGPANIKRKGGYTKILRLDTRKGDSREMCILEVIDV
jgi:large subunit ribosomal protein L17